MTIPAFSAPAVSTYLLGAIKTACSVDPSYGDMLIELGDPTSNKLPDIITVGEVRMTVKPTTFLGSGAQFWLNESYTVAVNINSWVSTGDSDDSSTIATSLNNRAWLLAFYVSEAVRNDPSLGGLVNQANPSDIVSTGPIWDEPPAAGLSVGITMQIHVEDLN